MKKTISIFCISLLLLVSCEKNKDNYELVNWVDLGLPSGLLWADRNLGASTPEDYYGYWFAWGDTAISRGRGWDWPDYCYGNSEDCLTKYCNNPEYGLNGFTDNRTKLEPCDDAATAHLGGRAHTPTKDDWQELIDNTTYTVSGRGAFFTAANGKSIYLPYGSFFFEGEYMSSSLYEQDPRYAYYLFEGGVDSWVDGKSLCVSIERRCSGFPVRAVCSPKH